MPPRALEIPPAWLALTLLCWGVASGHAPVAAGLAILLEWARWSRLRWALRPAQFERLADASSASFALCVVYQFTEHALDGVYAILRLAPWFLAPLLAAQLFSTQERLPAGALFLGARRAARAGETPAPPLDLRGPFGMACLLAAAAGEIAPLAYAGWAAAALSLLIAAQPRALPGRRPLALLAAGIAAFAIQAGWLALHRAAGDLVQTWFGQYIAMDQNPERTYTAIGAVGRLKLSERIGLWIAPPAQGTPPARLVEARYDSFRHGIWSSAEPRRVVVDAVAGRPEWPLAGAAGSGPSELVLRIERRRELGTLPLPAGAARLTGARVLEVQRTSLGAVVAEAPPGQLRYRVGYAPDRVHAPAPQAADLAVPDSYAALFQRLAAEIALGGLGAAAAVAKVERHFAAGFSYSLVQPGYVPWRLPLARFLLETRRGHCEHFATATVLLLRAGGVPARYVVGYAVEEYSPLERAYVVRARHAHAWAEAYVAGRWITVDTTPAVWYALEARDPPWWRGPLDVWSWAKGRCAALREAAASPPAPLLLATAGALLAILLWRLRRQLRPADRRASASFTRRARAATAGMAPLLEHLARRGVTPAATESLDRFLHRHLADGATGEALGTLVAEHYRQRFGPSAPGSPSAVRDLARRCRAFRAARGDVARAGAVSSGWRALRAACRRCRPLAGRPGTRR